ncbi:tRNA (adenosine(37)-N6)-threonylcarbamoyltransferase complex dimerization subunit type 1 TsaB [Candidatus Saccharibacteria bacterium]|nr:tRNA (adenosine(37)-N6)-threonylcarbamoyltransferase complex dimerization subunit type 1 TsaB [Candidatus Saccharibacteria bacterium]
MKLYLDTSTPTCILRLDDTEYTAELGRDMAEKLHEFIAEKLKENGKVWHDISEITFMSGPGSFTGLRIGASVVNTLADQLQIPLFDHHGKKHPVIIPEYGRPANISKPRK